MGDNGIILNDDGAMMRGVTVTGNRHAAGLVVAGTGNDVRGNVATDNATGISVNGAGNTIIGNFARNNSPQFDLEDNNGNCDSNVWRGNDFGTANIGCIH